jgi:class 3 adenylate cyclase
MVGWVDRGGLHPLTVAFVDPELEHRYQVEEGAVGIGGYRIICAASIVAWLAAIMVVPVGTDLSSSFSTAAGGLMVAVSTLCLLASRWAATLNRQHLFASLLTAANGLVIIWLATTADYFRGYAVAGIMVLFVFGFISRTRFVFAAPRTIIIAIGFFAAVAVFDGDGSLVVDSFFFVLASVGALLALRLLERDRRRVWYQQLVIIDQAEAIDEERRTSDRLLLNVLPASISERLKGGEFPIADSFPAVSVVFADIVGFTPLSARLSASEVIAILSGLFSHFDDLVSARGLEKIKTIGDAYMAVGGLPEPLIDHAERVVDLALAMVAAGAAGDWPDVSLRVGVHSGPAAGGVIGSRKFAYDVWGDTVNVAARLEQSGVAGRVHVSEETRLLVGDRFVFEPRGPVELRGLGRVPTYLVVAPASGVQAGEQPSGGTIHANVEDT